MSTLIKIIINKYFSTKYLIFMSLVKIYCVLSVILLIGMYFEFRYENYDEPLWNAATNGDLQNTRKLLKAGADPSNSDIEGLSPLSQVNSSIIQLKKEYNQGNPTISTSQIKRYEMIRSLLIKYGEKE